MKFLRKISLLLVFLIIFSYMPAVKAATTIEDVITKINAIADISATNYTTEKTKINEARTAYFELTPQDRDKVTNYSVLKQKMQDYYDALGLSKITSDSTGNPEMTDITTNNKILDIRNKVIDSTPQATGAKAGKDQLEAEYITPAYEFEYRYGQLTKKAQDSISGIKDTYLQRKGYLDEIYYDGYKFTNKENSVSKFLRTYSADGTLNDAKFKVLLKIIDDIGVFINNPVAQNFEDPLPYEKTALQDMLYALGFDNNYNEDANLTNLEKSKNAILKYTFSANDPTIKSLIEENDRIQKLIGRNNQGNYVNTVERFFSDTLLTWDNYTSTSTIPTSQTEKPLKTIIEDETRYLLQESNRAQNTVQYDNRKAAFQKLFNATSGADNLLAKENVSYPNSVVIKNLEDLFKNLSKDYAAMDYRIVNHPTVQARKRQVDKWYQDSLTVIYDKNAVEGYKREAKAIEDQFYAMTAADKENPNKITGLIDSYNSKSDEAKTFLTEVNIELNNLLIKAKGLQKARTYLNKTETMAVLDLNKGTLKESDRANIETALRAYKTEIPLAGKETDLMVEPLNHMQGLLNELDKRKLEAWKFKIDNARILQWGQDDIFVDDRNTILALDNAYKALPKEVKEHELLKGTVEPDYKSADGVYLGDTGKKVEELLNALIKIEAMDFIASHPVIKKEPADITIDTDEKDLNTALNDFVKISEKARELVKSLPLSDTHKFKANSEQIEKLYIEEKIKADKLKANGKYIVDLKPSDLPNDLSATEISALRTKIGTLQDIISKAMVFSKLFETNYPTTSKFADFQNYLDLLKQLLARLTEIETGQNSEMLANEFAKKHGRILEFLDNPATAKMRDPAQDANGVDNYKAIEAALNDFNALDDKVKAVLATPGATYEYPDGTTHSNVVIDLENLQKIEKSVNDDIKREQDDFVADYDSVKSLRGVDDVDKATAKDVELKKLEDRAGSTVAITEFPDTPYIDGLKKRLSQTVNELKKLRNDLNTQLKPVLQLKYDIEQSGLLNPGTDFEDPAVIAELKDKYNQYMELPAMTLPEAIIEKENLDNLLQPLFDRLKNIAANKLAEFEMKYADLLGRPEDATLEDYERVENALKELTPIEEGLFDDQIVEKDRAKKDREILENIKSDLENEINSLADEFLERHKDILGMENPLENDIDVINAKKLEEEDRNFYFQQWLDWAEEADKDYITLPNAVGKRVDEIHEGNTGKTVAEDLTEKIEQLKALMEGEEYTDTRPDNLISAVPFIPNKNIVPYDYEWKIRFNQPIDESSLYDIYVYDAQNVSAGLMQKADFVVPVLNYEGDVVTLELRGGYYIPNGKYYIYIGDEVATPDGRYLNMPKKMIFRILP